jgi:predicted RNase H-like HicB family nuclease
VTTRRFTSYTQARNQLRAVLDAASDGLVTTVVRGDVRFVVVAADRLREDLTLLRPANAAVTAEGGGWSVVLPGLPVHGDGDTLDEALADALDALREYAEDWNLRLHTAPNHRQHHALVALVDLSTDDQLRDWLVARSRDQAGSGPALAPG